MIATVLTPADSLIGASPGIKRSYFPDVVDLKGNESHFWLVVTHSTLRNILSFVCCPNEIPLGPRPPDLLNHWNSNFFLLKGQVLEPIRALEAGSSTKSSLSCNRKKLNATSVQVVLHRLTERITPKSAKKELCYHSFCSLKMTSARRIHLWNQNQSY